MQWVWVLLVRDGGRGVCFLEAVRECMCFVCWKRTSDGYGIFSFGKRPSELLLRELGSCASPSDWLIRQGRILTGASQIVEARTSITNAYRATLTPKEMGYHNSSKVPSNPTVHQSQPTPFETNIALPLHSSNIVAPRKNLLHFALPKSCLSHASRTLQS